MILGRNHLKMHGEPFKSWYHAKSFLVCMKTKGSPLGCPRNGNFAIFTAETQTAGISGTVLYGHY